MVLQCGTQSARFDAGRGGRKHPIFNIQGQSKGARVSDLLRSLRSRRVDLQDAMNQLVSIP
jgi:hypothetical protein